MRILAFEPWDRGSHRACRAMISQHSELDWRWHCLPGHSFAWRLRMGAVELIDQIDTATRERAPFDAVFATSLLDLAQLRALMPHGLLRESAPYILYMHENQAAYPVAKSAGESTQRDVQPALTNLSSLLAADAVFWNSAWNQRSFREGMQTVFRHAPSGVDGNRRLDAIDERSRVIWPPVDPPPSYVKFTWRDDSHKLDGRAFIDDLGVAYCEFACSGCDEMPGTAVVWPHRWEHDKGPDELLDLARKWTKPLGLRWTILGESSGSIPPALAQFEREFADDIDHFGGVDDRATYCAHLERCDWVLSTARHEFFGVAVVEALLTGCLPWLPDRLSYPEIIPRELAGHCGPDSPPEKPDFVRGRVYDHIFDAIAVNAVHDLDRAVQGVVARGPKQRR